MPSGVTVHQQPAAFTPAYAPQIFEATSSNIATVNFSFTVVCTDLITSQTETYQIEQRPLTGELVFDAKNFVINFMSHFVPNNAYGWQKCTNATRKIRVNIGETYGSTPVYTAGSNIDYIVWNSALDYLEYPTFSYSDYVYNAIASNVKYLTPLFNRVTFEDKSLFLYALTTQQNDIGTIRIDTFDSGNNFISSSDIDNPYEFSINYLEKYLCIDIGKKGLDNISSGLVTGTYPILPANTAYYTVTDVSNVGAPPAVTLTQLFRVDIACEEKHDVYSLQYLDKHGNFENIPLNKKSQTTLNSTKTTYDQNPYTLTSNIWSYSASTPNKRILTSSSTKTINLSSNWLTKEQIEVYSQVISSPVVYLDYGSSIGLIPVLVKNTSQPIPKFGNRDLYNMTLDIEFTYTDTWQND